MTNQLPPDWGQSTWGVKPTGQAGATTTPRRHAPPAPPNTRPPPPPARRRRRGRGLVAMLVGLIGLVLVALLLAAVGLVVWSVTTAQGPINATNSFVADIDDGDLDAAYESLCAEARDLYSPEEFAAHMTTAEAITDYTFVSAPVRADGHTIVTGTIELDGNPRAVEFGVLEEGDTWKVCEYIPLAGP